MLLVAAAVTGGDKGGGKGGGDKGGGKGNGGEGGDGGEGPLEEARPSDLEREAWRKRIAAADAEKAEAFMASGQVLEAAKLGHAKAQGQMAVNYFFGENGFPKDLHQCVGGEKDRAYSDKHRYASRL